MDDPERASDFVDSIGVNTHIEDSGPAYSSWTNWANVEAELAYTGITNVRDGVPYGGYTLPEYQRLADQGITFDLLISNGSVNIQSDLRNIDALEQSNPGAVASVEGSNEFNTNNDVLDGSSSFNNPSWGLGLDKSLSAAVKADPLLKTKTVVAASFANAGAQDIAAQGNLNGIVGASNWHAYFGPGSQPGANIASAVANATSTAPQEPVYITETGYGTAINSANAGGVTPDAQAKLTLNLLLDAKKDGASKTFLYELMDDNGDRSNPAAFGDYGLFNGDGTPKPVATAIHDLTTILSDPTSGAASFTPSPLGYTITGETAADNSLLLEKSSGVYDLVVWNEQPLPDASTTAVGPTSHTITLSTSTAADIKVYNPLTSTQPTQASSDTTTLSTAITDSPVIFEITPVSASGGLVIQDGARDVVSGANAGSGPITFSGSGGTLEIDGTSVPRNAIVGFAAGDTINLSSIAYDPNGKATLLAGNVLDVSENDQDYRLQLDPGQDFTGDQFTLSDPVGTDITVEPAPACYVTGTRIRVLRGSIEADVAVERLAVGDIAVTASGRHRPIRWIGHRVLHCAGRRVPPDAWPVRVLAGAFGGGLPERDLWLSPGHLVLVTPVTTDVDGVLVPIMCLINGTSIARVRSDTVTYWHVELDQHDLLLAEGLPAESYLDWGDRAFFTEDDDCASAGSDVIPGLGARCRPLAMDGRVVEAERRRLDALFATRLGAMAAWSSDVNVFLGL